MKKIISAVLTVSIILGTSTLAYADLKGRDSKSSGSYSTFEKNKVDARSATYEDDDRRDDEKSYGKAEVKKAEIKKSETKKNNSLEKSKEALIKKCDEMISQIKKLKGYIVTNEGKFIVEFKDQATGDAVLKSMDDAVARIEEYKKEISEATSAKELKDISKELQKNFMKHQTIVKRITGLTSTARLKIAYDEIKALSDKLGAGINGLTGESLKLDVEGLKKDLEEIEANLEEAKSDYLEAVVMFSSIIDDSKADKSFKAAHEKLMEAKKELQEALTEIKQLLVNIKTGVHKLDVKAEDKEDDDDDDDEEDHEDSDQDDDDDDDDDDHDQDENDDDDNDDEDDD